ncbi:serine/threonine-protein kinase [Lentisphaera profundi]|uniref:Serine/threonine-protein kinase n=1 Tax=Lentisphaera profundi TaxID=1658616 RepID=A0ABY7VTC7_9BACT|nr:serine/threonine-protein kinase [Lentisphaera profundi]WDE97458.1 serine/threonine-protein kinase [Lentisphaera profundi]
MEYKFYCHVCGLKLSVNEHLRGAEITCPKCTCDFFAPSPDYASGSRIGDFKIDALIGTGSTAEVYSAKHELMNRTSAIKIIRHDKLDHEEHLRFRREIELLSSYRHPHFIHVFYAGEFNDDYYLAMDMVNGKTCKNLIQIGGPLELTEALTYTLQIAEAMQYAWSQNLLIHRDIKPSNILIDQSTKHAYLTDLGIARCLEEPSDITQKDMILGSPHFMSPEQAAGKELDHRCDIYGLGATLYNCLSGVAPYEDYKAMEVLVQKLETDAIPIGQIQPGLPSVVRKAVHKLMAFNIDDRPQTWSEVIKLLRVTLSSAENLNVRPSFNKNFTKTATMKINTFSAL